MSSRILRQLDKLMSAAHATSDEDRLFVLESSFKISDVMRKNGKYSDALTLLGWSGRACGQLTDVKNQIKVMRRSSRAVWSVALSMKRKRQNFSKEICREAIPILKFLQQKMESTGTRDIHEISETQAWCFYYTAACFQYIKRYSRVYSYSHNAISLMKDTFGVDYKKYRVVGLSHAITGEAWECMKSYKYAIEEYENASEVFENAEDIKSVMYRKSCINYEKSKITSLRHANFFASLAKKKARNKLVKEASNDDSLNASGQSELLSVNSEI